VASPAAPLVADIDSVSAPDARTAVFHFRRRSPQQFFDATYQMYVVPQHLLAGVARDSLATSAFARRPVGSGRFRFVREEPGQLVEIAADTLNYRGRPGVGRVLWTVRGDPNAATRALLAGEADVWEQVRPDMLPQVVAAADLRPVAYPSLDLGFLVFNVRPAQNGAREHPLFGDRALRRALATAVDRASAARNVFDTLAYGDVAPVPRAVSGWAASATGPRFAADSARAALEALGWRDGDGDGIRERGGRPLAFTLLVPSTSAARMRYAVLLQAQLKTVGARVDVEPVDLARFATQLDRRAYDAALLATHTDPAPASLLQQWGAPGAGGRGAGNVGGYHNAAFEALMDSAGATFDHARARALYQRAFTVLADDAPAIWLYEPRNVAGVHRRLEPGALRADGWWSGLADWRVRPGATLARDRAAIAHTASAR
jgi:peptide/nickel transport system substrate-binding protein